MYVFVLTAFHEWFLSCVRAFHGNYNITAFVKIVKLIGCVFTSIRKSVLRKVMQNANFDRLQIFYRKTGKGHVEIILFRSKEKKNFFLISLVKSATSYLSPTKNLSNYRSISPKSHHMFPRTNGK